MIGMEMTGARREAVRLLGPDAVLRLEEAGLSLAYQEDLGLLTRRFSRLMLWLELMDLAGDEVLKDGDRLWIDARAVAREGREAVAEVGGDLPVPRPMSVGLGLRVVTERQWQALHELAEAAQDLCRFAARRWRAWPVVKRLADATSAWFRVQDSSDEMRQAG